MSMKDKEIFESEYDSLTEWRNHNLSDYKIALKKGLVSDICKMFGWVKKKENGYWTKERCLKEARKYSNTSAWKRESAGSLDAAYKNNWSQECKSHMSHHINNFKPIGYWTKEKIFEIALNYDNKRDWRNGDKASFRAAQKLDCYNECTAHMKNLQKKSNFWTKDNILKDAIKYGNKSEWYKNNKYTYDLSKKNNWFIEIINKIENK